ncbi:dihydroxyacetone kinase subunit L [Fodinisporobacter ferrooxydans]|uniref:Dihydroxyacetone kinase subunit L n=1 Tax=Fodinisporobacter ferrooxydans TaxID=2901836 RepID=A0ABY4CIY5_9BACL|nr:dihydroxyacetone kinase subunit L [Alicyclobacillaceae bacterium MYW30-H2]
MIRAIDLQNTFKAVAAAIRDKRDYLCELDSFAGDGDHGISMELGWNAVIEIPVTEQMDCGDYLKQCAKAFIAAVGASIGPLYGTAFLRASSKFSGKTSVEADDAVAAWKEAIQGIAQRGNAKLGDKTLLDTLLPCTETLESSWKNGDSLVSILDKAAEAAEAGMLSTKDMISNIGRSSRLGIRSKGGIDPGAASAYVVVKAIRDSIVEQSNLAKS